MSESFEFDNLIAGSQKAIVQTPGTVRISESFSRGQLLGKLTATGKWQVLDFDAIANFNDYGIAVEAVDTTDGSEDKTTVYVEGEFNENEVLFGYNDTADDWRAKLADHGIYLRKAVTTEGV
jgi:hypothetical protein